MTMTLQAVRNAVQQVLVSDDAVDEGALHRTMCSLPLMHVRGWMEGSFDDGREREI